VFHFALEQFIQPSKLEHTGRFLDKISSLDCIDLVKHGVIVDRQFLINTEKKVIWHIRLAQCVVINYCVFLSQTRTL